MDWLIDLQLPDFRPVARERRAAGERAFLDLLGRDRDAAGNSRRFESTEDASATGTRGLAEVAAASCQHGAPATWLRARDAETSSPAARNTIDQFAEA